MITKSEPLSQFVQKYEESGLSLGVFPTYNGTRYALRAIDPEEPSVGLSFVAAFAGNIEEANRPTAPAARKAASSKLDAMLHSAQANKFSLCYCLVDAETVAQFPEKYTAENIGDSYILVTRTREVLSDSYADVATEKKTRSVSKD